MNRLSLKRVGLAVVGTVVAIAVVAVVAGNADSTQLSMVFQLGPLEWLIPVAAGASVGMVAWVLLGVVAQNPTVPPRVHAERPCPACGRPILDDWRLCPHCGTLVNDRDGCQD